MGSLLSHPSISIKIVCTHRFVSISLSASLYKIKLQVIVRIKNEYAYAYLYCRVSNEYSVVTVLSTFPLLILEDRITQPVQVKDDI